MLPNLTIEEPNNKSEQNPLQLDPSITDLEDFCSSFLDFDSIKDWQEQGLPMDDVAISNLNLEKDGTFEKFGDLGTLIGENTEKVKLEDNKSFNLEKDDTFEKFGDLGTLIGENMEKVKLEDNKSFNLEKDDTFEKFGDLGTLIDENMNRVKLVELNNNKGLDSKLEKGDSIGKFESLGTFIDENMGKVSVKSEEVESDDSSSDSESESESSDSSSSSEEDVERVKEKVEMEDGEIHDSDVEKMVGWSEDEFGDEDGGVPKGPIKSRNEIKDLPHVPPVEASLQPHHLTVPVGAISSIIDAQVIVEGVEQHNPLNEGTIFWITESRSPLGIVDEIFGPVKSPFYIIRYNSENEVPEGIKQGTPVSFVPEFANHVLKDDLYKKGYDASGENDEEVSDDYEFSDDEEEAEYRKLQKMKKKRGTNEANYTNEFNERKSFKNRGGGSSKQNQFSRGQNNVVSKKSGGSFQNNTPQSGATQVATKQSQNHGNSPNFIPPSQQAGQAPGFTPSPNVVWMNGMPGQQGMMNGMPGQQGMLNGMPGQQGMMNGMPGQQGMMNGMPGQQSMMNGMPGQQGMMNGMPGQQGMMNGMPGLQGMMNGMPGQQGMMNGMPGQQGMMNGMPDQQGMMNGMPGLQGMMNGMSGLQGMMNGMPGQQGMMNGMPGQQGMMNGMLVQQGMVFPNGMMWPQQNMLPNGVPFLQQFAPNQNFATNGILPGTQPNFSGAPTFGPRPGPFSQNGPSQQFGVAMPMNMNGQQCSPTQGNTEMPREFNQGANQGSGRGPNHRSGGRFRGGRGRHQTK